MTLRALVIVSVALLSGWGLPDHAIAAGEVVDAVGSAATLRVGEGRLIRMSRAVSSVFIANPAIADVQVKSPRLVYLFGLQTGRTTIFAVDDAENVVFSGEVVVHHDLTGLRESLRALGDAPDVVVESANGALILSGAVEAAQTAENARRLAARYAGPSEEVINRIRVAGPNQINLQVRVAEISRTVVKQLGVRWSSLLSTGSLQIGLVGGNPINLAGAYTGSLGFASGNLDLNVLIDALVEEGLLSILAEPNVTALSGEEASFLAGGEFPIPVPQGNDTITIVYKKFGVSLSFMPTVLSGGRISLKVNPEVSELSRQDGLRIDGFDVPAIRTRRAETTVELGSGQSFAIAGLLNNTTQQDISKLPGLGSLPILGALFRSDTFRRGETELVILVTPYLVKPVSAPAMALPTDGFAVPTDANRLLFGRNYAQDPKRRDEVTQMLSGRQLTGSVGFVLE